MSNLLKYSSCLVTLSALLAACGSGSSSSSSSSPGTASAQLDNSGTLFGGVQTDSLSQASLNGVSLQSIATGSVDYYIPLRNDSSGSLSVSSASVGNPGDPSAWDIDISSCSSIASGASCNIGVGFIPGNVVDSNQLNQILTVTFSNGQTTTLAISGAVVESGSITSDMPSSIVPNASGDASGIITLYNGESQAQIITASDIVPTSQQGVTWEFIPNCDGAGSSTVQANSACSIVYNYHIESSAVSESAAVVSVSVPVVNSVTSAVTTPVVSSTPVAPQTTTAPFVVYYGGAVSVASGAGLITLQNVGTGTLSSITVSGLSGLTQTNNCTNVVANGSCSVSLIKPNNATVPSSVTITSASDSIVVPVVDQQLALSIESYSFGQQFSGAVLTKVVTISNTGSAALSSVTGVLSNNTNYAILSSSTCPSAGFTLAGFASCNVTIQYTAPTGSATQDTTLTVQATGQYNKTTNFTAQSITSSWSNVLASVSGYNESSASVLSLSRSSTNLFLGNSYAPDVAGARNVWSVNTNTSGATNITWNGSTYAGNYESSAPTAILWMNETGGGSPGIMVGHYDGSVQICALFFTSGCRAPFINSSESLGVTSIAGPLESQLYIGLSDKTTGTTGQLWLKTYAASAIQVTSITGAVGKMASDGTVTYIPVHDANSNGKLFSTGDLGADIAPSGLSSGEYITVVYYINGNLYAGTNLANVFQSIATSISPVTSASWTKINSSRLSSSSSITALAQAGGILYVGIGTVNAVSYTSGGAVYAYTNAAFTPAVGYTDTSSVSSMLVDGSVLRVGTMAGRIWSLTTN